MISKWTGLETHKVQQFDLLTVKKTLGLSKIFNKKQSPNSLISSINANSTAIHSCNASKTWQIKHVLNSGYLIDSSVSLVQTQRAIHSYSSGKVGLILRCSSTETNQLWSLFKSLTSSCKQILIRQHLFVSQTSWRFSR